MEEVRRTALALYRNGSPESQAGVRQFFDNMDVDHNGFVTKEEFVRYLAKNGVQLYNPEFFSALDNDGNGLLDFGEVVTFFYFSNFRGTWCKGTGCRAFLFGLYFTCACCFVKSSVTYELCLDCFEGKNYFHVHTEFLDNYAMLNVLKKEEGDSSGYIGTGTNDYIGTGTGTGTSDYIGTTTNNYTGTNIVGYTGTGTNIVGYTGTGTRGFHGSKLEKILNLMGTFNSGYEIGAVAASAGLCTIM